MLNNAHLFKQLHNFNITLVVWGLWRSNRDSNLWADVRGGSLGWLVPGVRIRLLYSPIRSDLERSSLEFAWSLIIWYHLPGFCMFLAGFVVNCRRFQSSMSFLACKAFYRPVGDKTLGDLSPGPEALLRMGNGQISRHSAAFCDVLSKCMVITCNDSDWCLQDVFPIIPFIFPIIMYLLF